MELAQSSGSDREPATTRVTWYDAMGTEVATREYAMEASRLTDAERTAIANDALVSPRGALSPARVRAILADHDVLPEFRPPVVRIHADQSRRLWLELDHAGEELRWIVLEDDGRVAGQVIVPAGTAFFGARGGVAVFGWPVGEGEFVPRFGRVRW